MDQRRTVLSNPRADYFRQRRAETKKRELEKQAILDRRKPENETTAYQLFNNAFEVMVERVYLHTDNEITNWGIKASKIYGDQRDIEFDLHHELPCVLTIVDLVPLYLEGARPRFLKLDAIARAYDVVVNHLEAWADYLSRPSMNHIEAPWEDLYALDDLAGWLFTLCRNQMATRAEDIIAMNPQLALQLRLFGKVEEALTDEDRRNGYVRTMEDEHESIMDTIPDDRKPKVDYDGLLERTVYELQ